MHITKFEDVIAWQKAKELTLLVYGLFYESKDYSFKDQITRAALSSMNNIAEGFDRGTDKELIYFLQISRGSSSEVRSMSYVAEAINYITKEQQQKIEKLTLDIANLTSGFIAKLRQVTNDKQQKTS